MNLQELFEQSRKAAIKVTKVSTLEFRLSGVDETKFVFGIRDGHYIAIPVNKVRNEPNPKYNTIGEGKVGLCMYGAGNIEEWPGDICDEPEDARKCPLFESIHTRASVLKSVQRDVEDPVWLQNEIPELATLLWVLDSPSIPIPWWKKLLLRFGWFTRERTSKVKALLGA
jgi:hypothetical protein